MALWGSSVRTRSSPFIVFKFPGGVMVAQMILVHLVGVRIPAGEHLGSTPKSVDFNERRRIGQGPSIDNFQSFYSRRLGVVLASSCGGSPR